MDDIILFAKANIKQARIIQKVLRGFCDHSGQRVGLNKSLLHLSANVHDQKAKEISDCLGIKHTSDLGRYLGIPSIHGKVTKNTFKFLLDKVYSSLASWKAKYIFMESRITLIKSVITSILGYEMQTVVLPRSIY